MGSRALADGNRLSESFFLADPYSSHSGSRPTFPLEYDGRRGPEDRPAALKTTKRSASLGLWFATSIHSRVRSRRWRRRTFLFTETACHLLPFEASWADKGWTHERGYEPRVGLTLTQSCSKTTQNRTFFAFFLVLEHLRSWEWTSVGS